MVAAEVFDGGKPVLQVPLDYIKQDSDGYYLFSLPATVYVQRLDGQPLNGEHYIQLTIDKNGNVKREVIM